MWTVEINLFSVKRYVIIDLDWYAMVTSCVENHMRCLADNIIVM
jgi:hypothetical protein